jgi:hypothetical protein
VVLLVCVVVDQELVAEVVPVVAPDRVDVVARIDRVVELDQDLTSLDPLVVGRPLLQAAGPAEPQVLESVVLDPLHVGGGDLVGHAADEGAS